MEIKELLGDAYKDGMTMDELTEALKGVQMPKDQSGDIEKLKETISRSNSEAAEWKRKYQSTLDEATRKAEEAEEKAKKDAELLAQLQKEKAIAGYRASYLAMGYDEALAEDTANALFEGNNERLFENQKKHMEAVEKKAREDALRGSGRPGGSGTDLSGDDSEAVRLVKAIGEQRAEADKIAKDGLSTYYLK
jgi:hypothetical protein